MGNPVAWLIPRSVRARAAVAAALAAAPLFVAGAMWIRHIVYTERMQFTQINAAQTAIERTTVVINLDTPGVGLKDESKMRCVTGADVFLVNDNSAEVQSIDDPIAFEVVGSGNTVLASSSDLRPLETNGPVLPGPTNLDTIAQQAPDDAEFKPDITTVTLGDAPAGGRTRLANRTYRVFSRDVAVIDLSRPDAACGQAGSAVARLHLFVLPFQAENAVGQVDRPLLPGVPAAVLLVALVAWIATDRALKPVERMRAKAARITATALDERLPVPNTRDHLARLALTLNDTLDRLAAAARSQQQFIADAAHELRSPISSLRVILETARTDTGSTDPGMLADAAAEAQRLHRLTDDLLLLSKLDSQRSNAHETIDMAALAAAKLADCGRIGKVQFTLHALAPAPVRGNTAQLDRLLTNLLDNAQRHARTAVTVDRDNDEVRVDVIDDGTGVPAEHRERIFERFTRLDESRDRTHGGTGLGLAIARDICVRHGGTLTVTQANGVGAQFTARFPASPPDLSR